MCLLDGLSVRWFACLFVCSIACLIVHLLGRSLPRLPAWWLLSMPVGLHDCVCCFVPWMLCQLGLFTLFVFSFACLFDCLLFIDVCCLISLFVSLLMCLSVGLFVFVYVCLIDCLPVCLSVRPSIRPFVRPYVCLSVCFAVCLPVCMLVLYVCESLCVTFVPITTSCSSLLFGLRFEWRWLFLMLLSIILPLCFCFFVSVLWCACVSPLGESAEAAALSTVWSVVLLVAELAIVL